MRVDREQLERAAREGIIEPAQTEALWQFLAADAPPAQEAVARLRVAHVLYYLGGLIAIGAASLFMTLGWERLGATGGCVIATAYAVACWRLAAWFLETKRLPIPAGILGALVTVCTPLAIFGLQNAIGWWPEGHDAYRDYHRWIDWHWWFMELGTLAVGATVFYRFRLPFLTLPIAVTLWYIGMDVAAVATGGAADWEQRRQYTLFFGLATVLLALWIDLRQRGPLDHAFWIYLFGLLGFWGALTASSSDSELARLGYCALNAGLIGIGIVLARRTFLVFGGLGISIYLGHLAYDVFADSLLFPFALTLIGLGIVAAGVWWQRHGDVVERSVQGHLPGNLAAARRHRA